MKELTSSESKAMMVDILNRLDRFCRKNSINYTLSDGTLLGAIRHKGFIPWDDDIDVIMPRADFEKFLRIYKDDRYQIIRAQKGSHFPYFFIRLTDSKTKVVFDNSSVGERRNTSYKSGLWIDIFPLDNMPDEEHLRNNHTRKVFFLMKLYRKKVMKQKWYKGQSFFRNLYWFGLKGATVPIPYSWLTKKIHKQMVKYNDRDTSVCCTYTTSWHPALPLPSAPFKSFGEQEFEGNRYMAVNDYDSYLKALYGDYMQLPPESQRVSRHSYRAFLIED